MPFIRLRSTTRSDRYRRSAGSTRAARVAALRRFLALVFVSLLLGMQQEAQWHGFQHFGEWLRGPHEQGLQLPQDNGPCVICALFAGGATAATNDRTDPAVKVDSASAPPPNVSSPTAAAPWFYLSRAPPTFL